MPDVSQSDAIMVAGIGGAAGLSGAAVIALKETMTRREVYATVISGTGFGAFVPPALIAVWKYDPAVAGLIGFICGLSCVGLVAGVKFVSDRFGKRPGAFVPMIRDAMKEETPANKGGGS